MRRWLFFLLLIVLVYALSQIGRSSKERSPFFKRVNETISIIVWILITVYTLGFLYWLYKEIFKW
jgi:hypothetical protein